MIVPVEHHLHSMLSREGNWPCLQLHKIRHAIVIIVVEAVRSRTPPDVMEEQEFPWLGGRGQVVIQPIILGTSWAIVRMHFQVAPRDREMNIPVIEGIIMLRSSHVICGKVKGL